MLRRNNYLPGIGEIPNEYVTFPENPNYIDPETGQVYAPGAQIGGPDRTLPNGGAVVDGVYIPKGIDWGSLGPQPAPPANTGENPFASPVAGLALEMAVRNQQLLDRIPAMTENQRALINKRLTKYGGDISQYEPYMEVGYDPTVGAMRSQAEGMRDYLVGLPELMAKAMKEGQKSGVTYKAPDTSGLMGSLEDIRESMAPKMNLSTQPTADTQERWATTLPVRPATQRPPQAGRLRPVRGNF